MTQPGGGRGGNDINLAALWIPVMPETKGLGEEMRKAGQDSKRKFEEGFNSGTSPEAMGQGFGSKLQQSIQKEFQHFELPYGASGFLDKFSNDIDQKLVSKLRGQATQALQSYRSEWDNLSAAQARATDAENKLSQARDNGFNKASIMLPLIREHKAAQDNLTESQAKASSALDVYNQKNAMLGDELAKVADGGKIVAGIMGGAIVLGAQLAVHAVESFVDAIAEGFEKGIELTKELAEKAVELGETYEHIGIQIHEFSTASGEDFEHMEEAAQHVFSTLDVAGNDTGKTMAQFSSILGATGEEVSSLTRHTLELQGRFTTLKAADLGSIFVAFNTPAEDADKALASLLESARNSGQDLGQLTSALSGTAAVTLEQAGLNIEQAGAFMGELLKLGAPGRQVMTGMATAMKEFGKEGVSFSDGMKLAGERLKELGDTAEGQDLAEKLFGARNWTVASAAVQDYMDVLNQGPDAFSANATGIDAFIDETSTLGNKVEEFKHKAMDAFKPFGDAAKNAAINGLNYISNWFSTHHTEIIGFIKTWGDKLIDFLPTAQKWAEDALRIFGLLAEGILYIWGPVATTLAAAGAGMLALTGHFSDAKDLLVSAAKFDPSKIGDMANNLADKIHDFKGDSESSAEFWQSIRDNFDGAVDAANRMPTGVGTGLAAGAFPAPDDHGGGAFPRGGGGGGPHDQGGGNTPWFPSGPGPGGAPAPGPPVGPGGHHADWDAIAQKESGGEWNKIFTTGVPLGGGLQIKPDTWYQFGGLAFSQYAYQASKEQQIAIAERILNGWGTVKGQGPGAWDNGKTYVEKKATGGPIGGMGFATAPIAVHGADGYGPEDFDSPEEYLRWYLMQGHMNHIADMGYQTGGPAGGFKLAPDPGGSGIDSDDYASMDEFRAAVHLAQILGYLNSMGRADGGPIGGGRHVLSGSGTKDDVPALLTKGEYVWDTDTVNKHGWLISALHKGTKGFDKGGPVSGLDEQGAQVDTIAVARAAQSLFGISDIGLWRSADGYNEHASGEAADIMVGNNKAAGDAIATYFLEHAGQFGVQYVLWQQAQWNPDGTSSGMTDRGGATANHLDHVHVRTLGGGFPQGQVPKGFAAPRSGKTSDEPSVIAQYSVGGGGSLPGGSNGSYYPGIEGQYGGGGVYGGQSYDQAYSAAKAVQDAKDRAADLDYQVSQAKKHVDELTQKLKDVGVSTKLDVFGKPYPLTPDEQAALPDKRKQIQDQLDEANHSLAVATRERAEQDGAVANAQRKEVESSYKKPSGTGDSSKSKAFPGAAELGKGILSGIGQELGFGDLFDKPPWEWGAVKLLTGGLNWAMGTANAWADEIGKGHTGMTGFQPIAGWDSSGGGGGDLAGGLLSGLTGSLGITMPKGGVSSGPNIDPKQGMPTPYGALGPAPGPVVQGDFMPINVSPNVDPKAILGPVQEQRNAQNSTLHGQTGGLPQ